MCALYGFINYGKILSKKELKKLVRNLSIASELRGTDASGVAYVRNGKIVIYKKPQPSHEVNFYFPQPSHEVNFYFPSDITILTGHTRMATHGDARNNYNNHPFVGHTAESDFALCHNGVLFNYEQVQKQEQLPKTKIKTDSYVAVQLIEKYGKADFETIGKMSEIVNGSFIFTVLTDEEKLYISKWNNPICLLHFQKLGIYVYTSTKEIMQMALRGTIFEKQTVDVIPVSEGEMVSIDKNGIIERSRFTPEYDDFFGYCGCRAFRETEDYDSYLCEYGNMFGVSNEEIMMLYEMGYEDEDIELMMMDHDMLRDCLNEAKECIGVYM